MPYFSREGKSSGFSVATSGSLELFVARNKCAGTTAISITQQRLRTDRERLADGQRLGGTEVRILRTCSVVDQARQLNFTLMYVEIRSSEPRAHLYKVRKCQQAVTTEGYILPSTQHPSPTLSKLRHHTTTTRPLSIDERGRLRMFIMDQIHSPRKSR